MTAYTSQASPDSWHRDSVPASFFRGVGGLKWFKVRTLMQIQLKTLAFKSTLELRG